MRIGQGYDVHRLAQGRDLILGGVHIPWDAGLDGHSDADVLCHAVMDALLGAAALGDIGRHFPDSDARWRGASSLVLLGAVRGMVGPVEHVDATVIAQAPKLDAYRLEMRENLAHALCVELDRVNVKFTTEEGLGFTGAGLGMAAMAVCLLP